jgi:hypothetical protein
MATKFRIADVRVTPILISDPPLLNIQGVHQPYTPRTIVEIETESGLIGLGETYGDTDYLRVAQAFAPRLVGSALAPGDLGARVRACTEEVELEQVDTSVRAAGLRGTRSLIKIGVTRTSAIRNIVASQVILSIKAANSSYSSSLRSTSGGRTGPADRPTARMPALTMLTA